MGVNLPSTGMWRGEVFAISDCLVMYALQNLSVLGLCLHINDWVLPGIIRFLCLGLILLMTNFRLQNRINMQCYDRIRLGNWGDGGWDMCLAGIYKPKMTDCLVYSFG